MGTWTKIKREVDFQEVNKITATRSETINGIVFSQTLDFVVPEADQETIYSYTKEETASYSDTKFDISSIDHSLAASAAEEIPT